MSTGIYNVATAQATPALVANSFSQAITRLMPNGDAPLVVMSSQIQEEKAISTEHGFYTKTMIFPSFTMSATATSGDTTLNVASNSTVIPGMLFQNFRTREQVLVNSVIGSTQVSVVRGFGSTAAASVLSTDSWYQSGTANEEASTRPQAVAIGAVQIKNYTQIFRNTWAVSGSAAAIELIAGDSVVAENKADCSKFHAADMERAFLFSQKYLAMRNGQPIRTMDGLYAITANTAYYPPSYSGAVNIFPAGSTTNFTQLEGFFDPCFNQVTDTSGPNTRVLFVGANARKVINNIGRLNSQYMMQNGQTSYGLQFKSFSIARGNFNMVEHPQFNSNSDWSKMAAAVDIAGIRQAYLNGRKTSKKEFNTEGNLAQDSGIDAVGGTLTTEVTLVVKNPPANAFVTNLTAAAVG